MPVSWDVRFLLLLPVVQIQGMSWSKLGEVLGYFNEDINKGERDAFLIPNSSQTLKEF